MKLPDSAADSFVLETLEDRIAPAALINGSTVQYTDNDGDVITIKLSKNLFTDAAVANNILHFDMGNVGTTGPQELNILDLSNNLDAKGVSISITAKLTGPTGNGTVNVGEIKAADVDLGNVVIKGDLGRIFSGDNVFTSAGLKSLTANSMGVFGTATGATNLGSVVKGDIGSIKILGDMKNAGIRTESDSLTLKYGNINSVFVGGSLIGGTNEFYGSIVAGANLNGGSLVGGNIGTAFIGGDLIGGTAAKTGSLYASGKINSATIQGSLYGSAYDHAGSVIGITNLGKVSVGGSLNGSSTSPTLLDNGSIFTNGSITSVKVGGSVNGGVGDNTGRIYSDGTISSATIGGNLQGGTGDNGGSIYASILTSVTVNGSLFGKDGYGSGSIKAEQLGTAVVLGRLEGGLGEYSGSVWSSESISVKSVKISGSTTGGDGDSSGSVIIENSDPAVAIKVGSIAIGSSVTGGHGTLSGSIIADGYVKSLTIGGNVEGSLIATSGIDNGFIKTVGAGTIAITGDVVGGVSDYSGYIYNAGYTKIGLLKIGGSLIGNTGGSSGVIQAFNADNIQITGEIRGGAGTTSGYIDMSGGSETFLKTLQVGGSIVGGNLNSSGGGISLNKGQIGSITIGGISGGAADNSGSVHVIADKVGKITVNGNIEGGTANYSGQLQVFQQNSQSTTLGSLVVNGSLLAGNTFGKTNTGAVVLGMQVGSISIAGSITGGTNSNDASGSVLISNNLTGKLTVGGSVTGGFNSAISGTIQVGGEANEILIKGSLIGGSADGGTHNASGALLFSNSVQKITINGSVKGGTLTNGSLGQNYGSIRADDTIGSLTIKGNLEGSEASGGQKALITAGGSYVTEAKSNLAIKTLTIGGSAKRATILGGYDLTGTGVNGSGAKSNGGSAQIGSVTVGGNWINSSLSTGSKTGADMVWGTADDVLLPNTSSPHLVASISSIAIKGSVDVPLFSSPNGFVAERIAKLLIGGINLTPAAGDPLQQIGSSTFFNLRQLS